MTREDALKLANEVVTAWISNPPTNGRGYADGWKPPTVAERTEAVIKLADFLMVPDPPSKLVAPKLEPSPPTLYGWPIDGSKGDPTYQQYRAAKSVLRAMEESGQPVPTVQVDAIRSLIGAFEATAPQAGG